MVAARWKEFRPEHFHNMDAPFLYKLLKRYYIYLYYIYYLYIYILYLLYIYYIL